MSVPAIQIGAPPAVTPAARPRRGIAIALLLSLALHVIVILSLVEWFKDAPESPSIVRATLARADEPAATPSPRTPTAEPEAARPVALPDTPDTAPDKVIETPQQLATTAMVTRAGEDDASESPRRHLDYAATVRQIATLGTGNAGVQPRIRRIVDGRADTPEDHWYFESWRRKVERIGKLNYPEQARERKIYGSLRLLVAIEPDGSLRDVRVVDSSGHKVLDDAAVRIVRLAAPYAPFSPGMRERTDVLEIVRTWQFKKRGSVSPS